MLISRLDIKCSVSSVEEKRAAEIFRTEILRRFPAVSFGEGTVVEFRTTADNNEDAFSITASDSGFVFSSVGIRGFIYAIGRFLRKAEICENGLNIVCDITGTFTPDKPVRGHQCGYRSMNNSYDMWDIDIYTQYLLDMIYFGANTAELAKDAPENVPYMKYTDLELFSLVSAVADSYNLNISVWNSNNEDTLEAALEHRKEMFNAMSRLDYLFPPGADPGDLPVKELFRWLEAMNAELHKKFPDALMTPSAQMPHSIRGWGEDFVAEMQKKPDFIDFVVQGPNRAFTTEELRRRIPKEYPIRFYPDITHNVRCETPVHFDRDDWHYAWTSTLSRECINPRPQEYKKYHFLNSQFSNGSVAYSEGINDDINKMVWSVLEWDMHTPLREILADYARLFMTGADAEKVADGIFGLENNWLVAPDASTGTELTYSIWREIGEETPALQSNWRYLSCMFRAACDLYVRRKVISENTLISKAKEKMRACDTTSALDILENTQTPAEINELYKEIEEISDKLYHLIGLQLSVEKHNATGWERGAVLDTINRPVTDRQYLAAMCRKAETEADKERFIDTVLGLTSRKKGEFCWFLALDGLDTLGEAQTPDFYMDFQGDRPEVNDGTLPMCLTKLFDHFEFRCHAGGLLYDKDCVLTVIYKNSPDNDTTEHLITVNGNTVYKGAQFGGAVNEEIEAVIPARFTARDYIIPAEYIENGCCFLKITEPQSGCEIAGIKIRGKE